MPHEVMSWRAQDGSLHATWGEAAATDAAVLIYRMLPDDLPSRDQVAAQMAYRMFQARDPEMLEAFGGLYQIMMSEPAPTPKLVVDNTTRPAKPSWIGDLLTRAGRTNE
jgi:hypothetical protein